MSLSIVPATIRRAKVFVAEHHRHHPAPHGALFAVGLAQAEQLVGVAVVGRPVSRMLDDGFTAEVTRVCVLPEILNGCSKLYGAARRMCKDGGYRRLVTYTLASEPGTSLRAAGWRRVEETRGGSWSRASRVRTDKAPTAPKVRWEADL